MQRFCKQTLYLYLQIGYLSRRYALTSTDVASWLLTKVKVWQSSSQSLIRPIENSSSSVSGTLIRSSIFQGTDTLVWADTGPTLIRSIRIKRHASVSPSSDTRIRACEELKQHSCKYIITQYKMLVQLSCCVVLCQFHQLLHQFMLANLLQAIIKLYRLQQVQTYNFLIMFMIESKTHRHKEKKTGQNVDLG